MVLTTIIPARNEDLHIERCVASARALGPVIVVDADSTDSTRHRAERAGARVLRHTWIGYSDQKNWALDQLSLGDEWVLFLDADEYLDEPACEAIRRGIERPGIAGFYLARRYMMLGRTLKHAYWYPDYQLRLFRADLGRFESRLVHEHLEVAGPVEILGADLIHENLKGISDWVTKIARYATLESQQIQIGSSETKRGSFFGTWPDRRRAVKDHIWSRLRGRTAIRFFWLYIVKGGFLDGRAGFAFCMAIAIQDLLIELNRLEYTIGRAPEQLRAKLRPVYPEQPAQLSADGRTSP